MEDQRCKAELDLAIKCYSTTPVNVTISGTHKGARSELQNSFLCENGKISIIVDITLAAFEIWSRLSISPNEIPVGIATRLIFLRLHGNKEPFDKVLLPSARHGLSE